MFFCQPCRAVGLNGKDAGLIRAKKHLADVYENGEVNLVDIGYVGNVEKINTELLEVLLDNDFIPVIATTGVGANGETYNINADSVAGEIAGALKAEKLLVLTDVKGIYADYRDEGLHFWNHTSVDVAADDQFLCFFKAQRRNKACFITIIRINTFNIS